MQERANKQIYRKKGKQLRGKNFLIMFHVMEYWGGRIAERKVKVCEILSNICSQNKEIIDKDVGFFLPSWRKISHKAAHGSFYNMGKLISRDFIVGAFSLADASGLLTDASDGNIGEGVGK